MLLADYESYVKCQEKVAELFKVRVNFIIYFRKHLRFYFRYIKGSNCLDEKMSFEHRSIG